MRRPSGDHCGSDADFSEAVSCSGYPPRERHQEDLAGARRLGREGHAPAVRREPELARRLDGGRLLDGQAVARRAPDAAALRAGAAVRARPA